MRKTLVTAISICMIIASITIIPEERNLSNCKEILLDNTDEDLNFISNITSVVTGTKIETLNIEDNDNLSDLPLGDNTPPIASAGEDQTIYEGGEASFNISGSIDPDGYITKYELDFGDGTNYTWIPDIEQINGTDILVYVTQSYGAYNRTWFDEDLPNVLADEGFNVIVTGPDQLDEITPFILNDYDQLWIISTNYSSIGVFSSSEINAIMSFQENGGSLFIAADHTYGGASAATDANQISTNYGITFSGYINHGHTEIYPFIVSHPLCEDVVSIWGHWSEASITSSNPLVDIIAVHNGYNMIAVLDNPNEGRMVFDTSFTRFEDGGDPNGHDILNADNIQYSKNIAKWLGERYTTELPPSIYHTYGDDGLGTDGVYTMTLKVTDNEGAINIDTCVVTILNLDPTTTIESATMDVEIGLRVAGRKYNDVGMTLYEEGNPIVYVSIERQPGSPDAQMAWVPVSLNMTKTYSVNVTFTPEDPPDIGANPVWIYIKFEDGSIEKIHHTFNVQQSKKRDSDHWNHVEPWEVDLNAHLIGHELSLKVTAEDPGSDDLTFLWNLVTVSTFYNNGISPDPYPSPWGTFPFLIDDIISCPYSGPGTYTLTLTDDDGGSISETIDLS